MGSSLPEWVRVGLVGMTQFVILLGLVGLILPIFPGLLVIWLAALGYGVAAGFTPLGVALFILITILAVAGSLVDNFLMGVGARKGGASCLTVLVALTAGILGTIFFPPFGGILAALLAIFLLEYFRLGDLHKALIAMFGLTAGWGLSYAIRLLIGVIMMVLWWLWVWKG